MNSILIGQIVNIHGIKGEVKVYPYTDDINNLSKLKEIYLDKDLKQIKHISVCRVQKNMLIMKLEGVETPEQANDLRKKDIYIPRSRLNKLDKGSYYIEDLIGSEIIDKLGQTIGTLEYVFNTGANDVYEIKTKESSIYLPAIKQVIKKVDIENKKIYVEIMEGLI